MKVAFGTVVYNSAYKYHEDFIHAINHQDTKNFDVLLLNDNLTEEECRHLTVNIQRKVSWVKSDTNNTIPALKIELIKSAKAKEYDLLVLGDFDDSFSENRIRQHIMNYESQYSFFYNELYIMDEGKRLFCMLPAAVEEINPILECNFLGFSNTALNMNTIDYTLLNSLYAKQTIAFDWMVFSLLLLQGYKGKKIDDCITYYRIHEHNIAGEIHYSSEELKKEIDIKIAHYLNLVDIDSRYIALYKFYSNLKNTFGADLLSEASAMNSGYWWGAIKKEHVLKGEALW